MGKPELLTYLEALSNRQNCATDLQNERRAVQKGYEAEFETYLDLMAQNFPAIILHDVLLRKSGTVQIDLVVITSHHIRLLEIKNVEGTFHHRNDNFYKGTYKMERNFLLRSKNAFDVMDSILRDHRINLALERKVIFMNWNATLYGHDPQFPILMRPQWQGYLEEMEKSAGVLTDYHTAIAKIILDSRPQTNPYQSKYDFTYEELEKGIWCSDCMGNKMTDKHRYLVCPHCRKVEGKLAGARRMLADYVLLFPERRLTAGVLQDWCGGMVGETAARKLVKQFKAQNRLTSCFSFAKEEIGR